MGTGYTRNDTSNNIADGNVIDAADLDGEFDAIQSAFNSTTGHTHDGTSAEGAPITVTGPAQEYVSTATELRGKTNNTYDLGSVTVQWKDLYVDGTGYIDSVDIDGGTIDGTVIGGSTTAAGSFTALTAASATVNGNITVTGTVDGRDVAADGTKLDGIESGATADQTAAEIRALVEAATDSNVFTDADHTKLNGIEASADVTDTANVTAAGALMDSELTNITAVKALDQGVATTDSPAFVGATINGNITVTGTVDGRDVAADGTKLDGIESGATADQTITAGAGLTGGGTGDVTLSHADTSSQASVNNSGNTFIQDVTLDTYGHVTGLTSATVTVNDATVTLSAGTGLIGGGDFTTNQGSNETITFNIDLNELSTSTTDGDGDYFVVVDTAGAERKLTKANINISGFNNDAGYVTSSGVTSVATGGGLTGGTITGTGTISHADTSSQGSVNNSGTTFIQDITLDTYGHVTAIGSATVDTTPPTTYGAVGTYTIGIVDNTAFYQGGNTVSGSTIKYWNYQNANTSVFSVVQSVNSDHIYNTGLSGTWRVMVRAFSSDANNNRRSSLFVRIS